MLDVVQTTMIHPHMITEGHRKGSGHSGVCVCVLTYELAYIVHVFIYIALVWIDIYIYIWTFLGFLPPGPTVHVLIVEMEVHIVHVSQSTHTINMRTLITVKERSRTFV